MKYSALGALAAAVAACSGDGQPQRLDAGPGAVFLCDPIAQTGCKSGEKCTWIVDLDATATSDEIGHVGCAPTGTAMTGGADCTDATAAVNGGADACVAGTLCISGTCKPICDPQLVDGTAAGACKTNFACSTYAGVLTSGNSPPVAGVCEPTCHPLTQKLTAGGGNACGSVDPARPSSTCVVSTGFRSFHCAPTKPSLYARTDRQPPLTDARGRYFGNGCAPGFLPFYFEDASAVMKTVCSGMCAPLKVDMVIAADPAHQDDNRGDRAALGKLAGDPAPLAGRSTCDADVKGSAMSSPHGQDCRYVWFPLARGNPTTALQVPFNDALGLCFAYEKFMTVTMPGMAQKFPEKSCAELPVTALATDPYGSAKQNGCYPLSQSRDGSRGVPRSALASFHVAEAAAPAVRHIFD